MRSAQLLFIGAKARLPAGGLRPCARVAARATVLDECLIDKHYFLRVWLALESGGTLKPRTVETRTRDRHLVL